MSKKQVDYIIAGFGLAGAVISFKLMQRGCKICVIDPDMPDTSSKIAGGMWNPIVFKRINKCWNADELLPSALKTYSEIEDILDTKLLFPNKVVRIFHNHEYANDYHAKCQLDTFKKYINCDQDKEFEKLFQPEFGYGGVHESGRLDVFNLLLHLKEYISQSQLFIQENFKDDQIVNASDGVSYKTINAKGIIFCRGHLESELPQFGYLPLVKTKGEILDVETEKEGFSGILNNSRFIIPIDKNKKRIGSTYDNHFDSIKPQEKNISRITDKLDDYLGNYKIVKHAAGIRPTVIDRRPIVGSHPSHSNYYIFNGLGTRGVLNAPFCADKLVNYIIDDQVIPSDISADRFSKD